MERVRCRSPLSRARRRSWWIHSDAVRTLQHVKREFHARIWAVPRLRDEETVPMKGDNDSTIRHEGRGSLRALGVRPRQRSKTVSRRHPRLPSSFRISLGLITTHDIEMGPKLRMRVGFSSPAPQAKPLQQMWIDELQPASALFGSTRPSAANRAPDPRGYLGRDPTASPSTTPEGRRLSSLAGLRQVCSTD